MRLILVPWCPGISRIAQQVTFNYKAYHVFLLCTKFTIHLSIINSDDTHPCFLLDNKFPKSLLYTIGWWILVVTHSALEPFTYKSFFHPRLYVSLATEGQSNSLYSTFSISALWYVIKGSVLFLKSYFDINTLVFSLYSIQNKQTKTPKLPSTLMEVFSLTWGIFALTKNSFTICMSLFLYGLHQLLVLDHHQTRHSTFLLFKSHLLGELHREDPKDFTW